MKNKISIDELTKIVVDARRRNLQAWIDQHHEGQQARFVEATGINQGELSLLLKDKSFGEKRARSLELMAGMPYLYLDQVFPAQGQGAEVVRLETREPDIADTIAALVRTMSPPGQYITLGQVQQLAKQYPAEAKRSLLS